MVLGGAVLGISALVLAMALYTGAEMVSTPASNVLSLELAPSHRNGHYMATFQLTWSVGMTLTPALFGWLLTTGPDAAWITLVLLTVACLVFGTGWRNRKETK
jgi:MFS family permease